jgi:archaellin
MGFTISQTIQTYNFGELTSFYGRIERYSIDKILGQIRATVALYPSLTEASTSFPLYLDGLHDSVPSQISTLITHNGIEFEYPTVFNFEVTTSIEVNEPIYEYNEVSEQIGYLDFDVDGNVIEKFNTVIKTVKTQIGTQIVTRKYADINKISGNVYKYFYPLVMEEYGKIFGIENIIEE